MGHYQIPRIAERIETLFGLDRNDDVVRLSVYRHRRRGSEHPVFWVVQYREVNRRIQRGSRQVSQFSGPRAASRVEDALRASRAMLAQSLKLAALRVDAGRATH